MTRIPEEDPEIKGHLVSWSAIWRAREELANDARAEVNHWIIKAKLAGHSYRQIRDDTGLSVAAIQIVLKKSGLEYEPEEELE